MKKMKFVELNDREVESVNGGCVGKKGILESIADDIKSIFTPSPTFPVKK